MDELTTPFEDVNFRDSFERMAWAMFVGEVSRAHLLRNDPELGSEDADEMMLEMRVRRDPGGRDGDGVHFVTDEEATMWSGFFATVVGAMTQRGDDWKDGAADIADDLLVEWRDRRDGTCTYEDDGDEDEDGEDDDGLDEN